MTESDETIYYRFLREGVNDDMKELMRRHRESLTLFLCGIVHNMDDAEELMLDAFAVAGMGRSVFYGKCSFKTWLFSIGRNQALKHTFKAAMDQFKAAEEAYAALTPQQKALVVNISVLITNSQAARISEADYQYALAHDLTGATVVLSKTSFTYNAKVQKPVVKTVKGLTLEEGKDYTAKWSNDSSKNAGTYTVTITGKGSYTGTTKATYKINKGANPLTIKAKTASVRYSKLKTKTQTLAVTKVIRFVRKATDKKAYKKVSGDRKITINKTTGKVTVKKGLKKGTYKVKVKVKAAGNTNYKASAVKTVTFKVKVK